MTQRRPSWQTPWGKVTTTSRSSWPSARSVVRCCKRLKLGEESTMTIIGQPLNRIDGPLKVTGQATYAYEHWEGGQPLYGVIVTATIGRGRIRDLDVSQAERSPGVRAVVTYQNAPAQGARDDSTPWPYSRARPTLSSPDISHYGEAVALVVAATLEQAQAAANLVHIVYSVEPGHFDLAAGKERAYAPKHLISWLPIVPTDTAVGDFESAFESAAVKVDQDYHTP